MCFSDDKLGINLNKTEYMFIGRAMRIYRDSELAADANFSSNATLLSFNLDFRL